MTTVQRAETGRIEASSHCVAVVPLGYEAFHFLPEQDEMRPMPARDIDLEVLTSAVELGIEDRGAVLAIYPAWFRDHALEALQRVRYMTGATRLLLYGSTLPPLAGAVLAAQASAIPVHMATPGVLHAAMQVLEREIFYYTWLTSVTGLSEPPVSLKLHARSLVPRSAFAVHSWPEPGVKAITSKDRTVPVPRTGRPMRLALAPRDVDATWVETVLAPAFGSPPVNKLPPTTLGPKYWGTKKFVEVVIYPVDVPVTGRLMTRALRPRSCPWCGETIAASPCPFCGAGGSNPVGGDS